MSPRFEIGQRVWLPIGLHAAWVPRTVVIRTFTGNRWVYSLRRDDGTLVLEGYVEAAMLSDDEVAQEVLVS